MRTFLLRLLAAAALAACGGGGDGAAVPFETVAGTDHSGFGSAEHVVLRTQRQLDQLWARMTVDAPAPAVDFSRVQLLAVFIGNRADGCAGVAVSSVSRTPTSLVVSYRETTAPPSAACTQQVTSPAQLVSIAKSTLPVEFEAE
jgi:hypothetical protein